MYKFEIAKPGDDILDQNLAQKNKLFSSEDRVLKIDQNTSEKATVADSVNHQVAHGRSYTPAFLTYVKDSSGNWYPITNGTIPISIYSYADSSHISTENTDGASRDVRTFVCVDKVV